MGNDAKQLFVLVSVLFIFQFNFGEFHKSAIYGEAQRIYVIVV